MNKPVIPVSAGEENVQSDWNEADVADDAFIQNKPSISGASGWSINDSDFNIAHIADGADLEVRTSRGLSAIVRTTGVARITIRGYTTGRGINRNGEELSVNIAVFDLHELGNVEAGGSVGQVLKITSINGTIPVYTPTDESSNESTGEENVQADWTEVDTNDDAFILNKPTIPVDTGENNVNADWDATTGDAEILNKPTIPIVPSSYAPVSAEQNVQSDWDALSGDALILNKPTIPVDTDTGEDNVQADWDETDDTDDAFILNKPVIPTSDTPSNFSRTSIASFNSAASAGGVSAVALSEAIESGHLVEFVLENTESAPNGYASLISDAILDLVAQTATPTSITNAISVKVIRETDNATTSFGHSTLHIWRGATDNALYVANARGTSIPTVIYKTIPWWADWARRT